MANNKESAVRKILDRNVERYLVKEFLMQETERAGFGGLTITRTPDGDRLSLKAERPGMVIGRRGKTINELQRKLNEDYGLEKAKLEVEEVEQAPLNAQIMASKIASALERGWYFRRAGHSTVLNIMEAGAKGVLITLSGKITGNRHRTQKFSAGHIKHCGETALRYMDVGFAVAKRKLGTIGCTVAIMRPGTVLPHEITVYTPTQIAEMEIKETVEEEAVE